MRKGGAAPGRPDSLNAGKRTGNFADFWSFLTAFTRLTVISGSNPSALDAIPCSSGKQGIALAGTGNGSAEEGIIPQGE
jgi:hypothetical protein